jgi:hypothetical protein
MLSQPQGNSFGARRAERRLLTLGQPCLDGISSISDASRARLVIRKRRDLIADGYEYRKLCFVKDG